MKTENKIYNNSYYYSLSKIKSKIRMPVVTITIWHCTENTRYETKIEHIRNKLNKIWLEEATIICLETLKEPIAKLLEIKLVRQKINSQKNFRKLEEKTKSQKQKNI